MHRRIPGAVLALTALLCAAVPTAQAFEVSPVFGVTVPYGRFSRVANFSYHIGAQGLQPVGERFAVGVGAQWHLFTLDPVEQATQSFSVMELSLLTRTELVELGAVQTFLTLGGGTYQGRSFAALGPEAPGNPLNRYAEENATDRDLGFHVGLAGAIDRGEDDRWQFAVNYRLIVDNDDRAEEDRAWRVDEETGAIALSHLWRNVSMITGTFSLFF